MSAKDLPRRAVIAEIAKAHSMTKIEAEQILRTALSAIADQLAERERFHIAEIGSITVAERNPRRYFNPRTRKESISEGVFALKIRISKAMKHRLR